MMTCNKMMNMTEEALVLQSRAHTLMDSLNGEKQVTFDMARIERFDSNTVAILLRLQSNLHRMGHSLLLKNITPGLMSQMIQHGAQYVFRFERPIQANRLQHVITLMLSRFF